MKYTSRVLARCVPLVLLAASLLVQAAPSQDKAAGGDEGSCAIVYGSNWAFVSKAPEGWSSACGKNAMKSTVITLWPAGQKRDALDALIYVTVSDKKLPTLKAFADDEQARFLTKGAGKATATEFAPPSSLKTNEPTVWRRFHQAGGEEEIVAYVEGPTTYLVVVLVASSTELLKRHEARFLRYVSDLAFMNKQP